MPGADCLTMEAVPLFDAINVCRGVHPTGGGGGGGGGIGELLLVIVPPPPPPAPIEDELGNCCGN